MGNSRLLRFVVNTNLRKIARVLNNLLEALLHRITSPGTPLRHHERPHPPEDEGHGERYILRLIGPVISVS